MAISTMRAARPSWRANLPFRSKARTRTMHSCSTALVAMPGVLDLPTRKTARLAAGLRTATSSVSARRRSACAIARDTRQATSCSFMKAQRSPSSATCCSQVRSGAAICRAAIISNWSTRSRRAYGRSATTCILCPAMARCRPSAGSARPTLMSAIWRCRSKKIWAVSRDIPRSRLRHDRPSRKRERFKLTYLARLRERSVGAQRHRVRASARRGFVARRHSCRYLARKIRLALFEERGDAFLDVGTRTQFDRQQPVDLHQFERMRHAGIAPEHLTRQRERNGRGVLHDLLRDLLGARQQAVGRDDFRNEAAFLRFIGTEDAPRETPAQGLVQSDQTGQEPGAASFRHETPSREHETELGLARGDLDVHRQGERDADADGGTVDRGDRRLLAIEDRLHEPTARGTGPRPGKHRSIARLGVEGVGAAGNVGAGTEAASGT